MAKKIKPKAEIKKNTILFLVEGRSDKLALELPLQDLFDRVDPRYKVIFALMKHRVEPPCDEDDDLPEEIENEDDTAADAYADEREEDAEDESEDDDEYDDDDNFDIAYDFGGDITATRDVWPRNIEKEISHRFFVPIIRKENVYARRLLKVIQIVDLDGAYLPEEALVPYAQQRAGMEGLYYNTEQNVIEGDPQKISRRNFHKRANLDALVSKNEIHIQNHKVPYAVYYFSSNLDHVLHHNANNKNKINMAEDFSMRFLDDPYGFCEYFNSIVPPAFAGLCYEETWDLVRESAGRLSIQPVTNLHLLLNEILNGEFPEPK